MRYIKNMNSTYAQERKWRPTVVIVDVVHASSFLWIAIIWIKRVHVGASSLMQDT